MIDASGHELAKHISSGGTSYGVRRYFKSFFSLIFFAVLCSRRSCVENKIIHGEKESRRLSVDVPVIALTCSCMYFLFPREHGSLIMLALDIKRDPLSAFNSVLPYDRRKMYIAICTLPSIYALYPDDRVSLIYWLPFKSFYP